jgi:hypothetical protein
MEQQSQKLVLAGGLRWAVVFVGMVLYSSGTLMAKDKAVCLDAKAVTSLKSIYVKRRDKHQDEVITMLKANNTIIQGTQDFAYRHAIEFKIAIKKDDPILVSLNNPNSIRATESNIKKFGRDDYIRRVKEGLDATQVKYRIDQLVSLASSKIGLSEPEIATLLAFADTRGKNEAFIEVVSKCQN